MNWQDFAAALGFVLAFSYGVAEVTARLVRLGLAATLGGRQEVTFASPLVRHPIQIVRAAVFLLTAVALILPALEFAGLEVQLGPDASRVRLWVLQSGLRMVLIGIAAYVLIRLVALAVQRFEAEIGSGTGLDVVERAKRARTLGNVVRNAATVLVSVAATLMVLRELRLDIMPILTGAGILGLAIGFGAQTLVKDVISGFFLILENQVRVGDVAEINGTGGFVESMNLRTIVLRDLEGVVHIFPNGSINTLANRTKDFSFYVIDVRVAYDQDTDSVVAVLRQVGHELRGDPVLAPHILEDLEILGVDAFADSYAIVKIRLKTMPLKQWEVGRELRRRIKKALAANGLEIPFPRLSVRLGRHSSAWRGEESGASRS